MVDFAIFEVRAGWMHGMVRSDTHELPIRASYTPSDSIRDFVDAIQSVRTVDPADCCWFQEAGESHWRFLRSGAHLQIEIFRFESTPMPGRHGSLVDPVFHPQTEWLDFAAMVLKALSNVEASIGLEAYESEWKHPFPMEAYRKLQRDLGVEAGSKVSPS
jgi:hypothetical protein